MKNRNVRFLRAAIPALALVLAPAAATAAPAFRTAGGEAGATVPDLLSDYERKVLHLELGRLLREVRALRENARESEDFAALRDATSSARNSGDSAAAAKAARDLAAAVEAKLAADPEAVAKLNRLSDVGALLERDKRLRKEQRALGVHRIQPHRAVAPQPEAAAPEAPGEHAAPAEEDAPQEPAPAPAEVAPQDAK
ncbi:MAG: hypothetical protein IJ783_11220 [Kiritimatiellae bacterium]|nr:hypothetical protein [Kiritimatiellia bacterium]